MASAIQLRLLGYGVTLVVHLYTYYDVTARLAVTTKDPIVADFATLQDKFITIWTFFFQIAYVSLGIVCDLLHLWSGYKNPLLKSIQDIRETLFSAIVWPTSLLVASIFWPIFLYDSLLVFPPYIDKVLSWWNNQVLHTYIIFVVFWELMFLERRERRHKLNVVVMVGYMVVYLLVLFKSFNERGTFVYPILTNIYGTIFFPIFFIVAVVVLLLGYTLQWPLSTILWGTNLKEKSDKKIQ